MEFRNINELLEFTEKIKGKTFKELDSFGYLENKKDKGRYGKVIETGFYGYPTNSDAKADFDNIGVELKVTGFKRNKDGRISAKERLSLGMIDYNEIVEEDFEFSKLLFKNEKLLIIWYEYEEGKNEEDFIIYDYQFYDMNLDLSIIRNDFYLIKEKVIKGEAHLLSEGDTAYLGAATKGSKGQIRTQPFSNKVAKPRCFSLKNSYMTGVLRSRGTPYIHTNDNKNVLEYVRACLKDYFWKKQSDILEAIGVNIKSGNVPKNLNKMISDRLIGKDRELEEKDNLFKKTRFIIKSMPFDKEGYPLERMGFRNLVLSEFDEDWIESDWKIFFEEVTIILICYEGSRKIKNGQRILKDIKTLTFTSEDIDRFEKTYNMVKESISKKDIKKLPYPEKFDYETLVISPKGNKGADAYNTFFDKDTTKTCFMLDKPYVYNKIKS